MRSFALLLRTPYEEKESREEDEGVIWVKILLGMPVVLIMLLFCYQNQEAVTLQFVLLPIENYHWVEIPRVPLPLFLVVLCSIFLGFIIGLLGDAYRRYQLKKAVRQKQKTIERLEKEMQSVRGPDSGESSFLSKER